MERKKCRKLRAKANRDRPTYGDRVTSVVEQFPEWRATISSPCLFAIDGI